MPPKNKQLITVRLRYKRNAVVLQLPANTTIVQLKSTLSEALAETRLLEHDGDGDIGDLRLAEPEDRADLAKGWKEIGSPKSTIDQYANEKSGSVDLAFTHGENTFEVELPVEDYDE